MLIEPILEQLYQLRLNGMAEAFRQQLADPGRLRAQLPRSASACWWTPSTAGSRAAP